MALDRNELAAKFLAALLANPERYKYIADKVERGELDQEQATEKNINKAFKLADQFIERCRRVGGDK